MVQAQSKIRNIKVLIGDLLKIVIFTFFISLILTGCLGRVTDQKPNQTVNLTDYGLEKNVATVLTFGAVWCKPCRAEISSLNLAHDQYGSNLQIKGLVVEGKTYGQVPTMDLVTHEFLGIDQESPRYSIGIDANWILFDRLKLNSGHQLPTIVFINPNGEIVRIIQRSLEYDTELKPLIELLLSNQLQQSPPPTDDPSDPNIPEIKSLTLADWSKKIGNTPDTEKYKNMTAAWRKGRSNYGFTADDMPFLDGQLTYKELPDGDVPMASEWSHDSETGKCYLKVIFKADGSFLSASGICT